MRSVGDALMWLGAGVGIFVGVGVMLGITLPGLPWLFAVGLAKLTLMAALGLIAAGAVVRRLAVRSEQRLVAPQPELPSNEDGR